MNYFGETDNGEAVAGVQVGGPDPMRLARLGIELREAGDLDAAEKIFDKLTGDFPDRPCGWQEMGVLEVRRGDVEKAATLFRRAVEAAPDDVLTLSHLAAHLQSMGRINEAHAALDAFQCSSARDAAKVAAMRDFVSYLETFPKWDVLDPLNEIEASPAFMRSDGVEAQIWHAIKDARPFSIIRLGDGEGAWMDLGSGDELSFPQLYAFNRRDILNLWFGSDALFESAAFQSVRGALMDSIEVADIVGIPYSIRISLEYDKKSLRGVPSCTNIIRWCQERLGDGGQRFCSNDINIELQDRGFFKDIFNAGVPIGVVSCHAELPFKLASQTGAQVERAHLVPEEKGFSAVLGDNGMQGPHFPDHFDRIMFELGKETQRGRIWLISAGYLGKHYCGKVREMGGVAIDIGSLSDGWCGKITRLHLTNADRFAL